SGAPSPRLARERAGEREIEDGKQAAQLGLGHGEAAAIDLRDVLDDREAEAAALARLVEPDAALLRNAALLARHAGSIIADLDLEPRAFPLHRFGHDARLCVFAGIVEQVAEHLLEILTLAAESDLGGAVQCDRDAALAVDLLQRARETLEDRH